MPAIMLFLLPPPEAVAKTMIPYSTFAGAVIGAVVIVVLVGVAVGVGTGVGADHVPKEGDKFSGYPPDFGEIHLLCFYHRYDNHGHCRNRGYAGGKVT